MGVVVVTRAILVRILFAVHGLIAVWRVYIVMEDVRYWYICTALGGLAVETVITLYKKKGNEWKWMCPSVFFYLLGVVPAVWFLELHELDVRIELKDTSNSTITHINASAEELKTTIEGLGLEIRIPLALTSDQWVRSIEQLLLLLLILGRWLLPKGKLTHDQLSQLLLVYIGTAADIVEFFEAFKEDQVRYNRILCMVILAIWSWSLLQFTMVLTATKVRKDQSGLLPRSFEDHDDSCCTPDVYGIVISIFMQDAPFLVLRLLLIFYYGVLSYTNMFFTCKNSLVILLLLYRLIVVQIERRMNKRKGGKGDEYINVSQSSSRARLMTTPNSNDSYYNYRTKINLREPIDDPTEPHINYVIKRRLSPPPLKQPTSDNEEEKQKLKATEDCNEHFSDYDNTSPEHHQMAEAKLDECIAALTELGKSASFTSNPSNRYVEHQVSAV